ncbi:hypothetical protein ACVBEQ_12365 [Nakamurella sp. GG22]
MVSVLSATVSSVAGSAQASGADDPLDPPASLDAAEEPAAADVVAALLEAALLAGELVDAALLLAVLLAVLVEAVSVEEPHAASRTSSDDPAAISRRR